MESFSELELEEEGPSWPEIRRIQGNSEGRLWCSVGCRQQGIRLHTKVQRLLLLVIVGRHIGHIAPSWGSGGSTSISPGSRSALTGRLSNAGN